MNQLNEKGLPDVDETDNQLDSNGMPELSKPLKQLQEDMDKIL